MFGCVNDSFLPKVLKSVVVDRLSWQLPPTGWGCYAVWRYDWNDSYGEISRFKNNVLLFCKQKHKTCSRRGLALKISQEVGCCTRLSKSIKYSAVTSEWNPLWRLLLVNSKQLWHTHPATVCLQQVTSHETAERDFVFLVTKGILLFNKNSSVSTAVISIIFSGTWQLLVAANWRSELPQRITLRSTGLIPDCDNHSVSYHVCSFQL